MNDRRKDGGRSLEGTTVRQIRLLHRLGRGGMGEVYEGHDETLRRPVAVKVLRAERRLDPLANRRFLREARILSRVEHPNICRVLDFIAGDDNDYIILELVPGRTLDRAIDEGLEVADRREIADQIAAALAAAHALGIVHRDLKPSNIMVTPDGTVKVLDFGLARTLGEAVIGSPLPSTPRDDSSGTRLPLTMAGRIAGTPAYMSPEQARGEPVTAASDMYSFGLILQRLFTGSGPYPEGTPANVLLQKAMWGDTEPVAGIERGLDRLVADLKNLDPSARPTASESVERLRWVWDTPGRRLRRALGVAAVIALAAATAVSTIGFVRARRAQRRAEASEAKAQFAEARAVAVNRFLTDMLGAANPRRMGRDVKVIDILDQAAETARSAFAGKPLTEAAVQHSLGTTYLALGSLVKAKNHLDRALRIRSGLLGRTSPPSLRTRTEIGKLLLAQGELDQAEARLADTTAACRRVLGEDDPTSLACATAYGRVLGSERKFERSISVLERVRSTCRPDAETETWIEATVFLAASLRELGRADEATSLVRDAMPVATRALGQAHPTTLRVLQALAILEDRLGRPEEAYRLFRQILDRCTSVFGAEHPYTFRTTLNVTVALSQLGRVQQAEDILRPLVPTCREKLGPVHPTTLSAMQGLAYAISEQKGREAEAEPLYRQRFDETRRILGPEHRVTLEAESSLAAYHAHFHRLEKAEPLYRDVLRKRRRSFGESHPATLRSKRALAKLLRAAHRPEEAAALSPRESP